LYYYDRSNNNNNNIIITILIIILSGRQVDNEWFGVVGGSSVEVLYFTGIWDIIDVAGLNAPELFAKYYAQTAAAQAEGAAPVLKAFLDGTLAY
jgi:hypothetical protein